MEIDSVQGCYQCKTPLEENHTSWFCSENCKNKYWEGDKSEDIRMKMTLPFKDYIKWRLDRLQKYLMEHPETNPTPYQPTLDK